MSGMIADDRKNLGHVGKIVTLLTFPIRLRPIPDYRGCLRFMVFISRQNVAPSGNVWEFPDICKLGLMVSLWLDFSGELNSLNCKNLSCICTEDTPVLSDFIG